MARFSVIGILAFVFAVGLAPSDASAAATYLYSCGKDGFYHVDVTDNGITHHYQLPFRCGPEFMLANGDIMRVVIGRKTEIPAAGQRFLTEIERAGPVVARRVVADTHRSPAPGSGRTTTIYLQPDRVGRNMSRILTSIDPKWKELPAAPALAR